MSEDATAAYRFAAFRALKFSVDDAILLAASRADWHDVEQALAKGCTHDQAVRIYI